MKVNYNGLRRSTSYLCNEPKNSSLQRSCSHSALPSMRKHGVTAALAPSSSTKSSGADKGAGFEYSVIASCAAYLRLITFRFCVPNF